MPYVVCLNHAPVSPLPAPQAAPVFDKIVFSKIKEKLGGRVKLMVSGEGRRAGQGRAGRCKQKAFPWLCSRQREARSAGGRVVKAGPFLYACCSPFRSLTCQPTWHALPWFVSYVPRFMRCSTLLRPALILTIALPLPFPASVLPCPARWRPTGAPRGGLPQGHHVLPRGAGERERGRGWMGACLAAWLAGGQGWWAAWEVDPV